MAKIADIIQYEGDNSTFIWKHPCESFDSPQYKRLLRKLKRTICFALSIEVTW